MVLEVLYPKPEDGIQPETLSVDIVAVHGLNGDPVKTWKPSESKDFWLKDYLPYDVPGARVLTFGYNADVAFGNTTANIKDHAIDLLGSLIDVREDDSEIKRPIIFIAHSLGGIIVKQALTWAHTEPRYGRIKDCTLGVVFFGTPHRGSDKAAYGSILANVATNVMRKPQSEMINALKTNSDELERLTGEFRFQATKFQILTFYEMKPMKIFSSLIVEKHSALLETSEEDQQPVDANHRDMCKFMSKDDQVYQKLVKRLIRMLKAKQDPADSGPSKALNQFYEVPHNVSSVFTGRADVGLQLTQGCLPTKPVNLQKLQKRFVLHGLGGSGKTQVSLKFAQDHRESFWGIFFIDASSANMARQAFSSMARICKVGETMQDFKKHLTHSLEPWLLIMDNADDPKLDISEFFPVGNRGFIIVTTRNPDCRCHATVGSMELYEMEKDEAITLLLRSSDLSHNEEGLRRLAQPIVQALGFLALAVVHAGASIRQKTCSLEDYLGVYTRHRHQFLTSGLLQGASSYKHSVYTTWEISRGCVKEMAKDTTNETAANALDLLNVFGFFHFDNITEGMFKSAWERFPELENFHWWMSKELRMVREHRFENWDPLPFREAIQLLSSYSLIRVSGSNNRISLHPLVHSWIRDSLVEEEISSRWDIAVSTLALASKTRNYSFQSQLAIHLRHCLGIRPFDVLLCSDDHPLDRIEMAAYISHVFFTSSQLNDALIISERTLEYSRLLLGDESDSTCSLTVLLAITYNTRREYEKASNLLNDMIDKSVHGRGAADALTLDMIVLLARAYRGLGRMQEAENLLIKTLADYKESLGDSHPDYLRALNELAAVYSDMNRNEERVDLLKIVVAKTKENEKEGDPLVLYTEWGLASAYEDLGLHQDALDIFQLVSEKYSDVLDEDHGVSLSMRAGMARCLSELGQPEKALPLVVEALAFGRRTNAQWFREGHEAYLEYLRVQCADTSTTGPKRSIEPQESRCQEGPESSSKRKWKFWRKSRLQSVGSSL